MAGLVKIYEGSYSVYRRGEMYCFLRGGHPALEISLEESLAQGGRYVFCAADKGEQRFRDMEEYFRRRNRYVRFLWIADPDEPPSRWHTCGAAWEKPDRLESDASVVMERYRLVLRQGLSVSCHEDSFHFAFPKETGFGYGMQTPGIWLEGTKGLRLGTKGEECGTFFGSVKSSDRDMFGKMDAGLRFFAAAEGSVGDRFRGFVRSAGSPALFPEDELEIRIRLTPHALLNGERTRFGLSQGVFSTCFSSDMGLPLRLKAGEDAALLFQQRPVRVFRDEEGRAVAKKSLYLGISGHFSQESKAVRLLCGLAGTETVGLTKDGQILFVPSMPGTEPYEDTSLGTSVWVGTVGNTAYYCQSEGAPLYAADNKGTMRFLEIPEREFAGGMPPVPILPYRGVRVDGEESLREWEEGIYIRRRERLDRQESVVTGSACLGEEDRSTGTERKRRNAEGDGVVAASCRGMMAQVKEDGSLSWIGFANVSQSRGLPDLRFKRVDEGIRRRFMQKEFVWVIREKEEMERAMPSQAFDFSVDGMGIRLLPGHWASEGGSHDTRVIIKFSNERSMEEVLEGDSVFETALQKARLPDGTAREGYEAFLQMAEDPDFQGILALNACISLDEMPKAAQVLMREIKPESFRAFYVAVQAGRILDSKEQGLVMERSKISALVDYTSDRKLLYGTEPPNFDYLTREVRIQVCESRICSFTSSSELLVNRFFEARAKAKEETDGNCLILWGRLADEEGVPKYQFRLKAEKEYGLSGSGIADVLVKEADMSADENGNGTFILNGRLKSREMDGSDLLGFGGEGSEDGLPFAALLLRMPENGKMMMDYGRLVLDVSKAVWREGSFPARFAVSLQGFLCGKGKPQDLGYRPIGAPVALGTPPSKWQGFCWKIDLGNPGGLSAGRGLAMELLTGFWENQNQETEYYIGVRLPGILSSGGELLQGLLRMGFDGISLEKQGKRYLFRLHNYSIGLLGMSFPPGSSDIFLFSDGNSVGWYGAYTGADTNDREGR